MVERSCAPARVRGVSGPCHAWVDESIHAPGEQTLTGLYVVAAAIADSTRVDSTREVLRDLVPRRQTRLHWRDESEPMKAKITAAIAASDVANVVVVGTPLNPRNQERARRKCLTRLLWELGNSWSVDTVWLESRTQSLNTKDLRLVDGLRAQGALVPGMRVEFGLPSEEPMLWVPDAVAGCVSAALKGDRTHLMTVQEMVDRIDVSMT